MVKRSVISLCIATAFTTFGFADEYDERKLFAKGAWEVELTHNTSSGSLWCSADTFNRNSQSMSIVAYENNSLALFLFDQDWSLTPRPVRFFLDIDYSRWDMTGNAEDIGVSLQMTDAQAAIKFLKELKKGSAVAVYTVEERRLATFSLSGSSAAITSLFECWKYITKDKDPFGGNADPFGSSADPFH
ncbi:hypothetical protein FIU85_04140 [Roseovarius sp. THAF8]|uniref:hypothetical protein n=1 Tax=Roseovarius sp. THAF8 TaxID=2587846 RepID=UPI0012A964F1|nr:hypothetical protein [Roseovarius sp. THAF8]QFT96483.1 hypothetical protein FIU85_04140 [Roseovarius sp. THAF8]